MTNRIILRPVSKLTLWIPVLVISIALASLTLISALSFESISKLLHWCTSFILLGWSNQPWISTLAVITALIILIGIIRAGIFIIRESIRIIRLARTVTPLRSASAELELRKTFSSSRTIWIVNDTHPHAFTFGLFRPKIVISSGLYTLLSTEEIHVICEHELHHAKRLDPLRRFLWELFRRLLYYVPSVADCAESCTRNQEFMADYALVSQSPNKKADLQSGLRKLFLVQERFTLDSGCSFSGDNKHLAWLFDKQKPEIIFSFTFSRALLSLAVILLASMMHVVETHASDNSNSLENSSSYCTAALEISAQSHDISTFGDFIRINYSPIEKNQTLLK